MHRMKYDLHIHSKYSHDSILEPEEIMRIAVNRGLSGVAVTDHNTIRGGLEAKEYEIRDFEIIVGSEIMTERGEIIGLFLSQEIKSRDVEGVISEIRKQGGITILPHPFDRLRHTALHPRDEDAKYIDAVEVLNSRYLLRKDSKKAFEFAKRHNLPFVAGSDAHLKNEIGNAGVVTEKKDIRQAILNNDVESFGKRSSLLNHIWTKELKIWKKATRSG